MSVITLTPQARELLMTAIEGYLDHDLDYDLREANRAVAPAGLGSGPRRTSTRCTPRQSI